MKKIQNPNKHTHKISSAMCILCFIAVLFIIARYRIILCIHQLLNTQRKRRHVHNGPLPDITGKEVLMFAMTRVGLETIVLHRMTRCRNTRVSLT